MKNIIAIFIIGIVLSGCSSTIERLQRVGKAPELANLEVPVDENQLSPAQKEQQTKAYMRRTNSLWQPGSTSFFRDNRAWRIGDILRVVINIKDSATVANNTQQKRNSKENGGIGELFGKQKALYATLGMPKTGVVNNTIPNLLSLSGDRNIEGSGNITRQESIQTEIAALVRQVLPNGNLVIEAHQEIRINHELREIKVAGIVRPRDISSENAISSDQIAEARISYGGRGVLSDVQQPRVGSQVVDIISPF